MSPRKPTPPRSRLATTARYAATFLAGVFLGLVMGATGCANPLVRAKPLERIPPAQEAYITVSRSFVVVMARTEDGHAAQGSGTVVHDLAGHQLILTVAHLFAGNETQALILADPGTSGNGEALPGKLLSKDDDLDLALVEVSGRLTSREVLPVASTPPEAFDPVYLMGNPSGAPTTAGPGVLSSLHRTMHGSEVYQITAFCWPGASGGPVTNNRAELIGVIRAVLSVDDPTVATPKSVLVPEVCYAAPLSSVRTFLKKVGVIL